MATFGYMMQAVLPVRPMILVTASCIAALGGSPVAAQEYPTKNIRMVVPFPAGGGTDTVARIVAQKLT